MQNFDRDACDSLDHHHHDELNRVLDDVAAKRMQKQPVPLAAACSNYETSPITNRSTMVEQKTTAVYTYV